MSKETYTIDATGKTVGKLAVKIANLLRGKDKPEFVPYDDKGDFVVVKNVDKMKLTGKKFSQKMYYRHSGYIGHLKKVPLKRVFDKKPGEVLIKAVWGMLPTNKLRTRIIKKLKIYESREKA